MPLSEDEQRILKDIERSFYESDPAFARSVTHTRLSRGVRVVSVLAFVGFAVCFGVLLACFWLSFYVAIVAFLGMVACASIFIGNVRRFGATTLLGLFIPNAVAHRPEAEPTEYLAQPSTESPSPPPAKPVSRRDRQTIATPSAGPPGERISPMELLRQSFRRLRFPKRK